MPNGRTHGAVGMVAGGMTTMATMSTLDSAGDFAEVIGGVVGGILGAKLPDRIEPALTPCHRGPAHSLAALAVIAKTDLGPLRVKCRQNAERFAMLAIDPAVSQSDRQGYELAALFWRFVAGLLTGGKAGYVSHLLMDGCTPMSLPVLGLR